MAEELKPCPFCGEVPKIEPRFSMFGTIDGFVVEHDCESLGVLIQAPMTWMGNNAKQVVEAWNTRAERTCTYVEHVDAFGHYYQCLECQYKMDGGEFEHYRPAHCMGCGSKIKAVMER